MNTRVLTARLVDLKKLDLDIMVAANGTNSDKNDTPMSKPVMYIHAGYPKTGTTSIQRFFQLNREDLKGRGVLYPVSGIHGTGHVKFAIPFLSEEYLCRMRSSNLLCDADAGERTKQQIENEIAESGSRIDSIVISAESFDGTDQAGIARLVQLYQDDFQLKAIIYIRRQDKYAESIHAQAYRVREMSFDRDKPLKKYSFSYEYYVDLWSESLGSDNLILREYPENAQNNQLINDFMSAISVDSFPMHSKEIRLNSRMDRLALEFMQHHTGLSYGDSTYFMVEELLGKYSEIHKAAKKFKFFYSPQERQLMLENCRESNNRLSEKYFNGELFENIPEPDLMTEWESFPGLSKSQIESIDKFLLEHRVGENVLNRA